jgi:tRNA threonylcarbamoyladenosine biosynthesis protein TsaE
MQQVKGQIRRVHQASIQCSSEQAMQRLGAQLANGLAGRTLILLDGELGAGKSVLVRALIHALGYTGRVKSPTYTLIESYELEEKKSGIAHIAHLDLYRLADPDELEYLGFDDVMDSHELVLIEWPEKALDRLPAGQIHIQISYAGDNTRRVDISSSCRLAITQETS